MKGDKMKTTIAYKIEIDHEADTVSLKEQGRKGFLSKSYQISIFSVASALREAAYYLLERAYYIEHSNDFVTPTFNRQTLTEQTDKMIRDNTLSIFETA